MQHQAVGLVDSDYLALRNVNLSYQLPTNLHYPVWNKSGYGLCQC